MWIYLVISDKFRIFVSMKEKVTDISEAISSLANQIESMQKTQRILRPPFLNHQVCLAHLLR